MNRCDDGVGSRGRLGLRVRLTALATALSAVVGGLLVWLGWWLVGDVVAAVPQLPPGSTIDVDGVPVAAGQLGEALRDEARSRVLVAGLVAVGLVVLASALLAWAITGYVLRPLHDVTATAKRLSAQSLGERLHLSGPRDEVAELADTFDAMLDRLQASFDAQQRFVANASHELRTPLSVIRTEIDVTTSDPEADTAELRRMATVVGDAAERAQQLVSGLLVLASTEATGLRQRESVELSAVARKAVRVVDAQIRDKGLRVAVSEEPVSVVGDPALLERVIGNLVENAVRHNIDGGWITVTVEPDATDVRFTVASSGEVIDDGRVAALFEPFHRGGVQRTAKEGAGLGLSIVRAVIHAHGGSLTAEPVAGGGLSVTARLPEVR